MGRCPGARRAAGHLGAAGRGACFNGAARLVAAEWSIGLPKGVSTLLLWFYQHSIEKLLIRQVLMKVDMKINRVGMYENCL